ncbi:MAG: transcription antitermination factor NusB [Chloroflexi bacterium]|nr:transcription antitermination factor NusB [Chloroflexota bacterium]
MKTRRQARAIALQALFEIDSVGHGKDQVVRRRIEEESLAEEGATFATGLVEGVLSYRPELDKIISRHAPEWPVDQLAVVDRNILRIALYELLHVDEVPIKVAVNEAVELAKTFGSDTAPRFVNGVLGAFLTEHPAGELRRGS